MTPLKSGESSTSSSSILLFKPYENPRTFSTELQIHKAEDIPHLSDVQRRSLEIEKSINSVALDTPDKDVPSRSITILQKDFSNQQSDSPPEEHILLKVAPVRSEHSNWLKPQKLYYSRASHLDISLKEKSNVMYNKYNAKNIYERNIDTFSEYNILSILQQIKMVVSAYRTSHNFSDQLTIHVLLAGFTGQLKGWLDTHLTEEDKQDIFQSVSLDPLRNTILQDGHTISYSTYSDP
uniref:DUF7746 domain-containing protein n=1 Tax=Solanum lycopersicum TaxID=4081 RepID=A0A3Q7H7D6_SOLLC